MLVEQFRDAQSEGDDKGIRAVIEQTVDSSPSLRNERDVIEEFVEPLSATKRASA
ncbi:MAG: type I restriction endonuclease subunit R, EcoR124 family [Ilumatobacter sp.]|uniref:type I restriction endonuclease subunit R, EcoR124 family n=1 Tax=Ilumatobacter sp. TaxID=1967498 RepID=UPI00391A393C